MADNKYLPTPEARILFPALFEPAAMEGETKKRYKVLLLIPKAPAVKADREKGRYAALKAAAKKAADERWPNGYPAKFNIPFKDGDKEFAEAGDDPGYKEHYKGCWVVSASLNEFKQEGDPNKKPIVIDGNCREITDPERVYSGCYGMASVMAIAYDMAGNKGVKFVLAAVQITRDGEQIGGSRATDVFEVETQDIPNTDFESATPAADPF